MEDIEIEYLDEYKDVVLPGIKTSVEGRTTQMPERRRILSDSSDSSSLDADIFQKLFDGKFLEDELVTETGSNSNYKRRSRPSSSSSESNDALDALYNRQSSQIKSNRRNRLESYDSIDDLGDALMAPAQRSKTGLKTTGRKLLGDTLPRTKANMIYEKNPNACAVFKSKAKSECLSPGTRPNGQSSSSNSSNVSLLPNKKKAVTIIKAKKPDLNPPKHEPKKDPLHLQEFSDDTESDSSFEYESDIYGYGDTDEDDREISKQIIDLSTDSSLVPSLAETVTPVVSDDDSFNQQQRKQRTPISSNDRLQFYLSNLSSAEIPPTKQKYSYLDKKSHSHSVAHNRSENSTAEGLLKTTLDSLSTSTPTENIRNDSEEDSRADFVDINLTYETVERSSLNLAKEIIRIDAERSKEFEKRSASKTGSPSSSTIKLESTVTDTSSYKRHVRKLSYSNEQLNELKVPRSQRRRVKSDDTVPKRGRGRPPKKATLQLQKSLKQNETNEEEYPAVSSKTTEPTSEPPSLIKKSRRGRPPKIKKEENCDLLVTNQSSKQANVLPSKNITKTLNVAKNVKHKTSQLYKRAKVEETASGKETMEIGLDSNLNNINVVDAVLDVKEHESLTSAEECQNESGRCCQPDGERTYLDSSQNHCSPKVVEDSEAKEISRLDEENLERNLPVQLLETKTDLVESGEDRIEASQTYGGKTIKMSEERILDRQNVESLILSSGDTETKRDTNNLIDKTVENKRKDGSGDNAEVSLRKITPKAKAGKRAPKFRRSSNLSETIPMDNYSSTNEVSFVNETSKTSNQEKPSSSNHKNDSLESLSTMQHARATEDGPKVLSMQSKSNATEDIIISTSPLKVTESVQNFDQTTETITLDNKALKHDRKSTTGSETRSESELKDSDSIRYALTRSECKLDIQESLDITHAAAIVDIPSNPLNNSSEKLKSIDSRSTQNQTDVDHLVIVKPRFGLYREMKQLIKGVNEWENETHEVIGRATRSRVGSPMPPKSVEDETIKEHTDTNVKSSKAPKATQSGQNDNETFSSSRQRTGNDNEVDIENSIPESDSNEIKKVFDGDHQQAHFEVESTESHHAESTQFPSTPGTCSSNSSHRKLRVLLKSAVPRSKVNFRQKLESIGEHGEIEESTDTSTEVDIVIRGTQDYADESSKLTKVNARDTKSAENESAYNAYKVDMKNEEKQISRGDAYVEGNENQTETENKIGENATKTLNLQNDQVDMVANEQQRQLEETSSENDNLNEMNAGNEQQETVKEKMDTTLQETEGKPQEHQRENPILDEATGVTENVLQSCRVPGSFYTNTDASEPDETDAPKKFIRAELKRVKKTGIESIAMAPPAASQLRLRRVERPPKPSEPKKKRRKLSASTVEEDDKTEDSTKLPLLLSTGSKELPSVEEPTTSLQKEEATVIDWNHATSTSNKAIEVKKTSPLKSHFTALLSSGDSASIDNSVIITKTALKSTAEPFKKVELPVTPASGINISVSYYSPPKMALTQTETVKMLTLNVETKKADVTSITGQPQGLPTEKETSSAETRKKVKDRKSHVVQSAKAKRPTPPAKVGSLQVEESPSIMDSAKKGKNKAGKREKLISKERTPPVQRKISKISRESLSDVDAKNINAVPGRSLKKSESEVSESIDAETEGDSKTVRNTELRRLGRLADKKSEIVLEPSVPLGEKASSSESRDLSSEHKKRSTRMLTLSLPQVKTAVTRASSHCRSLAGTPTPMESPNDQQQSTLLQEMLPKPQRQFRRSNKAVNTKEFAQDQVQTLAIVPEKRKRKLSDKPNAAVKRPREQLPITHPPVAFPVRITAANTSTASPSVLTRTEPIETVEAPGPPMHIANQQEKSMDMQLAEKPLPTKIRKLRVRLNRRVIKNWMNGVGSASTSQLSSAESEIANVPSLLRGDADPHKAQVVSQKELSKRPVAMSVPLPVPLPNLEVKAEETELVQQNSILAQGTDASSLPGQTTGETPSDSVSTANQNKNANPISFINASSNSIPSANSLIDQNTFGATKMFSFLYPSRYQRSYGNVGLDFCCPNLDGPMQAIDPTRLHSKAEVPVLELPQYMVISTKIISKQDKNIPEKVRAKLEQLAAKEALPCSMQSVAQVTLDPAVSTPVVPTSLPLPALTVSKSTDPSGEQVAPKITKAPTAVSVGAASHLTPPSSSGEKQHEDLHARVQYFDKVLQSLARRAASISVSERKKVIENVVNSSSLLPADVDVGTKLLKNYEYHLYAVTNSSVAGISQHRSVGGSGIPSSKGIPSTICDKNSRTLSVASVSSTLASQPIYDSGKNIIGYQYKKSKVASPLIPSSAASGTKRMGQETGTALTPTIGQQKGSLTFKGTNEKCSKNARNNFTANTNETFRVAKRLGSGTVVPLNSFLAQTAPECISNSLQQANKGSSIPAMSTIPISAKSRSSNQNLLIVNQALSQPEECILPDAIGSVGTVTEIKDEVADTETLT